MTQIKCALFSPSQLIGDELEPMWCPDGCHRTLTVSDLYLPDGWTWHDGYYLCPSCSKLWDKKFNNIKSLMEDEK